MSAYTTPLSVASENQLSENEVAQKIAFDAEKNLETKSKWHLLPPLPPVLNWLIPLFIFVLSAVLFER